MNVDRPVSPDSVLVPVEHRTDPKPQETADVLRRLERLTGGAADDGDLVFDAATGRLGVRRKDEVATSPDSVSAIQMARDGFFNRLVVTSQGRGVAQGRVIKWTIGAAVAGALPVPGASSAVIAANVAMINDVASAMGMRVSISTVMGSFPLAASANVFGRAVFMELARAMGWAGGPLGVAGVSAAGALTAALQTWMVGQLVIAICESGGGVLSGGEAQSVLADAQASFEETVAPKVREEMRRKAGLG